VFGDVCTMNFADKSGSKLPELNHVFSPYVLGDLCSGFALV
jgi:hypothetical protein